MRRIYRERNDGGRIIFRPTKILLIVALALLAAAAGITLFVKPAEPETQESAPEKRGEAPEYLNIDNQWAMFLVNSKNPLPDNYDTELATASVYSADGKDHLMDARAAEYMERMLSDAKDAGIELVVVSAFRTFEYQQKNFDDSVRARMETEGMSYEDAYAGTIREVAFPGESEHNAGLSADILSAEYMSLNDDGFKDTEAYKWLRAHSADYGFILRYPERKYRYTGFVFEPWHFRFVGVYYANEIEKSGLCLEEYFDSQGWLDSDGKAIKMTGPVDPDDRSQTFTRKPEQTVTVII